MQLEKKDLIGMSAITILLITSILGLVPEATDTHVCVEDNETEYCDHLSSTGRTCYPKQDTRKGSNLCTGTWKPIDRSDLKEESKKEIVYQEGPAGGRIERVVDDDNYLTDVCYYDERKQFCSEFE